MQPWFWAVTGAGERWGLGFFSRLQALGTSLPDWMLYNLPDALWLFACLSMIQGVWGFRWGREALAWGSLLVIGAMGSEALQAAGILEGTGDWGDVVGYGGAVVLMYWAFNLSTTRLYAYMFSS
ncbi:MAG: hypothetical protein D6722_09840 [Bacteroidetes bacterium]|nr:MAG: hypothetical protein D6722_09840 [Bacteroidota bacterium]